MKLNTSQAGSLILAVVAFLIITPLSRAETYYFMAQNSNYSWFSTDNWFTNDPVDNALHPAMNLPGPPDTAVIKGSVNATASPITLNSLVVSSSSTVNYGAFSVATVVMDGASSFSGSIVNVDTEMDITSGTPAIGSGTVLTIEKGATLFIPAGSGLECTASTIFNVGEISLAASSFLSSGTNLVNMGIIDASTNAILSGTGTFDNQGKVQSETGTFKVGPFNTWLSTTGTARYETASSNAVITFVSGLTVPAGATFIFAGAGTTVWPNGATVAGTAQVGILITNSTLLDPGTLEADSYVVSNGVIHVVSTATTASTINFVNGSIGPVLGGPTLNLDAGSFAYIVGGLDVAGSVVNNSGTIIWKKGDLYAPGGVINILAGGLFDCQITHSGTDGNIGAFGYFGGIINNWGTFRKSLGTNGVVIVGKGPVFNNMGLVDSQSGYIQFAGGTNNGTFNMAGGAEIWFGSATNYLMPGARFTGTNTVRVMQFAVLFLSTPITVANISVQDSAAIDGPGDLTVTNTCFLTAGVVQGSGQLIVPAGAIILVQGGGTPVIRQRTINNSGTILVTLNGVELGGGATLNNEAGGVINCITNGGIGYDGTPPMAVLNNYGTYLRSGGNSQVVLWLNFTNYNVAQFLASSVETYNFVQVSGSTVIASNAGVNAGSVIPLTILGGTLTGVGTVYGNVSNSAVVIPATTGGAPGTLNTGTYFQSASGNLNVLIGGTNSGQYSQVNCGSGTLAGTVSVAFVNGFNPVPGQKFYIVVGNYPRTGTFTGFSGLHASNGIVLVPSFTYYNVVLTAANDPIITNVVFTAHLATFSYLSSAGYTNSIQFTDSLNPPQWQTLTNIIGDGTVKNIIDPGMTNSMRFYRVAFQ